MMDDVRARIEKALAGSHTLERELGGGGMSRTYLAREHALNRRVVVKVLSPDLLHGISVERFKREVLLAAQLQHPHVVPVLSAGDADGLPWFTMPYVDGDSLRKRLGQGQIGISEGIAILRDVAKALTYAHANNVVHRDIKPDNVLLSSGSATVTDFGIAKAISASRTDPGGGATLTQAGTAIGTPAYMAPEQATGDPSLDHRADLYAFGAMAYEVLAGQQVFPDLSLPKLMVAHLSERPRDVRELRPDVPPVLAQLVMQCLEKDADKRPADAATVARVLDASAISGSSSASPAVLLGGNQSLRTALVRWAAVSAIVVLVAWAATVVIGLPDWALAGAIGVMLAGLPSIVATWWVQRTASKAVTATPTLTPGGSQVATGALATFALKASPHLSWARTWKAGAVAVGAFVLLVSGFMVSRAMGIGPAASLMSKGTFGDRESVVVADFRPPAGDTLLGLTVAEALRTDLGQSKNLRVLTRASVREVLQRMQRPSESAVLFDVAREIATREGAKAVIDGEITRLGSGYVLAARLVGSQTGDELGTYRETATGDEDLINAVGKLSRKIREEVGESLKGIRASYSLDRVTTSSLPALRKYMEAIKAEETGGELERAMKLYEEAIALDTGFAMAWRKLAIVRQSGQLSREKQLEAMSAAWRFRDRLSDEERLLTEGTYWVNGPEGDAQKALAAYEQLLARDSLNRVALNNAAVIYFGQGHFTKAYELYRKATLQPDAAATTYSNLLGAALTVGVSAGMIDSLEAASRERFPMYANLWEMQVLRLWGKQDVDSFRSVSEEARRTARTRRQSDRSLFFLARININTGRAAEALAAETEREIATARTRIGPEASGAPVGAWMDTAIDSALIAVLLLGDDVRGREYLQRAFSRTAVDAVPPVDRNWIDGAMLAALAGDSALARAALQGYERDRVRMDPYRAYTTPSMTAKVAFAARRWNDAVAALAASAKERGDPFVEDSFLRALAHERAGRPDSAIAWFEWIAKRETALLNMPVFHPIARKKLGELYDATGDTAKAIDHYEWFAERWKNADASLQSTVRAVRARAAALKAKHRPGD